MPALIEIDVERKLVRTVCSGTVADEDFVHAREEMLADPRFDPAFDRLWDFSGVKEEHVSEETLATLVKTSPHTGDISRAVVVSMAPQAFARVLEFISQSRRFQRRIAAFPTRDAAERWIQSERLARAPEEALLSPARGN
ncbi:MAG: hypothetical protein ACR2NX_07610 [Chthoniobacterales bacterium]